MKGRVARSGSCAVCNLDFGLRRILFYRSFRIVLSTIDLNELAQLRMVWVSRRLWQRASASKLQTVVW
ncbi:hypothetical protein BMI87_21410 [Thioclava sp. F28-4]|nr:hypothetical protein BMI87_21410 [Thioclava sp. F28-4]